MITPLLVVHHFKLNQLHTFNHKHYFKDDIVTFSQRLNIEKKITVQAIEFCIFSQLGSV